MKLVSFLLPLLFFNTINSYAQRVFKQECYIGGEINEETIDSIYSKDKLDLIFFSKHLNKYLPTYFPTQIKSKKAHSKPVIKKANGSYLVEYYNDLNYLYKYVYSGKSGDFDVNIIYDNKNRPIKLVESFLDLHHSENMLYTITFNLLYNIEGVLIVIESIDGFGYICKTQLIKE